MARYLCSLWIVLLTFLQGVRGQDNVLQDSMVVSKEGETATITCQYSVSNFYSLHWYKQYQGDRVVFLLQLFLEKPEKKDNFHADLNKTKQESKLSIMNVHFRDIATYFCAVFGAGNKITFGGGTKLKVSPNLEDSPPSIYELRPDASAVGEKKDKAACLFTDYFPNSLKVKSKKGEKEMEANGSVVVVKEENAEKETGSYGIVLWGDKDDNFHCAASDKNGQKFVSNPADPGTCLAESGDNGSFETDFRLNLLSLTVLGLRVVFLKSVAFNLLLTFRLWSRRG